MSFRKEKKFRVTHSDWILISQKFKSNGMLTLHPGRRVTSLYFDTIQKQMFFDSEEGLLPRKKIRIRWYDRTNRFHKETKTSSVEGRFKEAEIFDNYTHENLLHTSMLDAQYGLIKPQLIVSYNRSYFILGGVRLTADQNISYTNPISNINHSIYDPECVVEVKTPQDCGEDFIQSILANPTERFSKYCRGMLFHNK